MYVLYLRYELFFDCGARDYSFKSVSLTVVASGADNWLKLQATHILAHDDFGQNETAFPEARCISANGSCQKRLQGASLATEARV